MWNEFITLFAAMEPIPIILLSVGLIFCIIEMFVPGFGFFGITGSISIVAGIVLRFAREFSLAQLFLLVLIIFTILLIVGLIVIRSAKKGLLSKTPLINNKTAVPIQFENEELKELIQSKAITTVECKPIGKIEIENKEYEAITRGEYLIVGVQVEVVDVDGNLLVIKELKSE